MRETIMMLLQGEGLRCFWADGGFVPPRCPRYGILSLLLAQGDYHRANAWWDNDDDGEPGSWVPVRQWRRRPSSKALPRSTCCSWHSGWTPTSSSSSSSRTPRSPTASTLLTRNSKVLPSWKTSLLTFGRWSFRWFLKRDWGGSHVISNWSSKSSERSAKTKRRSVFLAGATDHREGSGFSS